MTSDNYVCRTPQDTQSLPAMNIFSSVFSLTAIYMRPSHRPADSRTDHAVRVQQDTDGQVAVEDEVAGVESGELARLEDLLAGVLAADGVVGADDLAGVGALLPDVGVAGGGWQPPCRCRCRAPITHVFLHKLDGKICF